MKNRSVNAIWLAALLGLGLPIMADEFSELMAAGFGQALTASQQQQVKRKIPLAGDWLYLAALVELDKGDYRQAQKLLRQYLALPDANVHRLKARSVFNVVRRYQQLDGFREYLQLLRIRDRDQPLQLQQALIQFLRSDADDVLMNKAKLLQAHSLLELENNPEAALQRYQQQAQQLERGEDLYSAQLGVIYCLHRLGRLSQARQAATAMQQSLSGGLFARDDLLSRAWQLRLDATMPLLQPYASVTTPLLWGSGSRLDLDRPVASGQNHRPLWLQSGLTQLSGQSLTLWITRQSDWRWLQPDILRMASRAGYTPMISLWYFGDEISPEFVVANWDAYVSMVNNQLIPLLQHLPQAYLLLEPEYNKNGIENWPEWDQRMSQIIDLVKQKLPNVKVGLVLGDWDQTGQRPSYETSLNAIGKSDFIGSMLMIANYTESIHSDPDWSPWIRSLRLGRSLQQRFNKPWMLAYVAIASQPYWQRRQQVELAKLEAYLPQMKSYGLFALNWFSAVDEPAQTGWFADAETSFGLLQADYQPKPVFQQWQQLAQQPSIAANLAQWQVNGGRNSASFQFAFEYWTQWQLSVRYQQRLLWRQSGAGSEALLEWQNFSGFGGHFEVELTWQGQRHQDSFNLNIGLRSEQRPAPPMATLEQWQQLHLTAIEQQTHVSLVFDTDRPIDDGLQLGLVDSNGAFRTARLAAYSQPHPEGYQVEFALSELAAGWRRYQNGTGFIWREQPVGPVQLMISNNTAKPIAITTKQIELH
ncbi:hypothetical protein [uncultured Ferrimonas sp.]|uniref:hypothetical protein n=1 Tax=uncultured Ferrimonas sp. TaxID=432640 RepID=UPI00261F17B5|nr:hypothetical protein [uncultured Ferrimonas sp.]